MNNPHTECSPEIIDDGPQRVSGWVWFNRSALWMAVWMFHIGLNKHNGSMIGFGAFIILVNPFMHWLKPERAAMRCERERP